MAMVQQPKRQFHPLPVIGHPEAWYQKHIKQADEAGDKVALHAYKVGQYVTLALEPKRSWEEKAKYFRHALKHHCMPCAEDDAETCAFYEKLNALVCRYASQEARRLAHQEHQGYSMRLDMGVPREQLAEEAEVFFPNLLGQECAEYLTPEAYQEICALRDRWI